MLSPQAETIDAHVYSKSWRVYVRSNEKVQDKVEPLQDVTMSDYDFLCWLLVTKGQQTPNTSVTRHVCLDRVTVCRAGGHP